MRRGQITPPLGPRLNEAGTECVHRSVRQGASRSDTRSVTVHEWT